MCRRIFSTCVVYLSDQGGGASRPRVAFDQRANYEVNRRLIDEASPIIIEGCNLYLRSDVLAVRRVRATRAGRRSLRYTVIFTGDGLRLSHVPRGYRPLVWTCQCVTSVSLALSCRSAPPEAWAHTIFSHRVEYNSRNGQCVYVARGVRPPTVWPAAPSEMCKNES